MKSVQHNDTLAAETEDERAARYERGDFEIPDNAVILEGDAAAAHGRELLSNVFSAEELGRLTRGGRPSVGHAAANGESRQRRVRLDDVLDRALEDRIARDNSNASDIMRAALTQYLLHEEPQQPRTKGAHRSATTGRYVTTTKGRYASRKVQSKQASK